MALHYELHFHDNLDGDTLCGRMEVESAAHAEEKIRDMGFAHEEVVKFQLYGIGDDGAGPMFVIGEWEKSVLGITMTRREDAFYEGEWHLGNVWTRRQCQREYGRG